MMDDTFESMEDQDELEEEADAEVEKVLWELTAGVWIYCFIDVNVDDVLSQAMGLFASFWNNFYLIHVIN